MKVRLARADDLPDLVILRCALWPQRDIGEHERLLRRRFESGARFATLVLVNTHRQLCGFVELMRDLGWPGEPGRVLLQGVFVTPPMRRRGGATQLLDVAQRWAHACGATSFYCDLPHDDEGARDMLRLLGFAGDEHWVRATRACGAAVAQRRRTSA